MLRRMPVVYDLLRGPVAADAIEAVTDPVFAHDLADAMGLTNADALPPAALMAEWAVRCVYTDGFEAPLPMVADCGDAARELVDACLGGVRDPATVHRFLHAVDTYFAHGRRARPGLWPDVDVRHAPCPRDDSDMRAALRPSHDVAQEDAAATGAAHRRGWALVTQARFVLPARRTTINCTGRIDAIPPAAPPLPLSCPNSTLASTAT